MTLPPTPPAPPVPTAPPRPVAPVPTAVSSFAARLDQAMDSPSAPTVTDPSASTTGATLVGAPSGVRPSQLPAVTLGAMIRSTTAASASPAASQAAAVTGPAVPGSRTSDATSAPVAPGATVSPGEGLLAGRMVTLPVDGRVSSTFGPRVHPISGHRKDHHGLDVAAPTGTDVRALTGGTVVGAGDRGGYGLTVDVDHGDGIVTRYAHLSAIDVAVGDTLVVGGVLGAVGSTGATTGPHLHLEVRHDDRPIDPETVLGHVH